MSYPPISDIFRLHPAVITKEWFYDQQIWLAPFH
jgi:hypothetical protein